MTLQSGLSNGITTHWSFHTHSYTKVHTDKKITFNAVKVAAKVVMAYQHLSQLQGDEARFSARPFSYFWADAMSQAILISCISSLLPFYYSLISAWSVASVPIRTPIFCGDVSRCMNARGPLLVVVRRGKREQPLVCLNSSSFNQVPGRRVWRYCRSQTARSRSQGGGFH